MSSYYLYTNRILRVLPKEKKKEKEKEIEIDTLPEDYTLTIYSDLSHFDEVVRYTYAKHPELIRNIMYENSQVHTIKDWRNRRKENPGHMKITRPHECHIFVSHEYQETDYQIELSVSYVKDSRGDHVKLMTEQGCASEESLLSKLTLSSVNPDVLRDYVNTSMKYVKTEFSNLKKSLKDTMNVYYYKKDFWVLFSKTPKRSNSTIYLKQGVKEKLLKDVKEFFSASTRDVYLSFGIPYKSVFLIHGPPGTGKTSTIKSIASEMDCDLYVLPITKDMLDTHLVDAFTYINEQEEKERIVVIEDVDTMFDTRKHGDDVNGITLQGFLNCLDGFTCVEGTMLFITANKPEVLDDAIMRSCRIDQKFELGYADKYQTQQMFKTFFPEQSSDFKEFYQDIKDKQFTTAMLQEFFFYNRDHPKIIELKDEFFSIISHNDPKQYKNIKDDEQHLYM